MIYEIPRPTIHISDNFNDQSFSTPINSFVHIKTIKEKDTNSVRIRWYHI